MKKVLIALVVAVLLQSPAQADPEGTFSGARAAIQRSKIEYFADGWDEETTAKFEEIDYVYNGIILSGTGGDFMKKEPVRIIATVSQENGSVNVKEEVIYPVWSDLNKAHVLRNVIFDRKVATKKVKGQKSYLGLDRKWHPVK